jgi:4-hydroxy-tetrahydrodipicolinate reductase
MIDVVIAGASGRMGRHLLEAAVAHDALRVHGALERPGSPTIGQDAGQLAGLGPLGVTITDTPETTLAGAQVLIDFTRPEATEHHGALCRQNDCALVVGTTGLSGTQRAGLGEAAQTVPVVFAPNMSLGVNLMFELVRTAAEALGPNYDVEILEAHHRHKVDAPSGTAVRLGERVAEVLGRDLEHDAVYGRHGRTGPRDDRTIGFETIRAGDIVGDHTVLFAGSGERLEITHRASSRMTFASGAMRAAVWVADQPPGLYDMADVLGLAQPPSRASND